MTTTATHLHPVQIHHPAPANYVAATSIDHALELLAGASEGSARLIAGGSDLLLEIERGGRQGISLLIDISRIPGADAIVVAGGIARLGPLTTHADVVASAALVAGALPLAQACLEVASPQLRNRATVAGNIVTASPANDTISALMALDASVTLTSLRGSRVMPIGEFITGFRTTVLAADEMITEITVPLLGDAARGIYVKLGNRSAQAISVVHLAAVVHFGDDGTTVRAARVAVGSVAPTVVLIDAAVEALVGQQLDDASIAAAATATAAAVRPIADIRATAEYRVDTVEVVTRRALQALAGDRQAIRWPAAPPRLDVTPDRSPPPPDTGMLTADDPISTTINGRLRSAAGAAGTTLLDWLREAHGLTGTKEGCAEGECGACTVILDGAAVMSCLVPAGRGAGASITTVEGLADGALLHPLQDAFVACGAVQCGYCTPGFVVAGTALLEEVPDPTEDQIRLGLSGNLCRCTGYSAIVAAVEQASVTIRRGVDA